MWGIPIAQLAVVDLAPTCLPANLIIAPPREPRTGDNTVKANRNFIWNEDRAEVGIGTLIVFIAMVLVAAVAAAVLINTSGSLQQRAQSTGEGATQQAAESMKIMAVEGQKDGTTDVIDALYIQLGLAAGANPIDLAKLTVRYSPGSAASTDYKHGSAVSSTEFTTSIVRLVTNTASTGTILYPGEIVKIQVGADDATNDLGLAERSDVAMSFIPEFGNPIPLEFTTPNIYDQTYMQIR